MQHNSDAAGLNPTRDFCCISSRSLSLQPQFPSGPQLYAAPSIRRKKSPNNNLTTVTSGATCVVDCFQFAVMKMSGSVLLELFTVTFTWAFNYMPEFNLILFCFSPNQPAVQRLVVFAFHLEELGFLTWGSVGWGLLAWAAGTDAYLMRRQVFWAHLSVIQFCCHHKHIIILKCCSLICLKLSF